MVVFQEYQIVSQVFDQIKEVLCFICVKILFGAVVDFEEKARLGRDFPRVCRLVHIP